MSHDAAAAVDIARARAEDEPDSRPPITLDDLDLAQSTPPHHHALPATRCRCAEPVIAEDMYGDQRCALCGRSPWTQPPHVGSQ